MNSAEKRNPLLDTMDTAVRNLLAMTGSVKVAADAIEYNGLKIIPISKVSMGFAAGGADLMQRTKQQTPMGTGAGITETPMALLVIDGDDVRVINPVAESQDSKTSELVKAVLSILQNKKTK